MLVTAVGQSADKWSWPENVPGCIAREVNRVAARLGGINSSQLNSLLRVRWEAVKDRGDKSVLPVVQCIELALAHFPLGIIAYLGRHKTTGLSNSEQLALLFTATGFAATDEERAKLWECIEKLRISPDLAPPKTHPSRSAVAGFRTTSQEKSFQQLLRLAELFFEGSSSMSALRVRPRLNPLIVGPTGSGKSYLVESAAKQLGAAYRRVTCGDWIPIGASHEYTPTLFAVMDLAMVHERVLVLIDELDKLSTDASSAWARSCMLDVWTLLDRNPQVSAFQKYSKNAEASVVIEADVKQMVCSRLFIVGAGTWQNLHRGNRALGFATRDISETTLRADIVASGEVPLELTLRFNPDFLHLSYPSNEDSQKIFDEAGITALAASVGVSLDPRRHDWTVGGMRSLEDVATTLLLKQRELQRCAQPYRHPEGASTTRNNL